MSGDEMPTFRFYPSAMEAGAFEETDSPCAGCRRNRGWLYDGVVYGALVSGDERLCPWCVADGRVAELGGFFNEVDGEAPDQDEVESRTPGFASWQDHGWPVHHGQATVFVGVVGRAELDRLGQAAVDAMTAEVASWRWDKEQVHSFVDSLTTVGQPTGYAWRCQTCGGYICRADFT